jgi:alpha-L-fucosidase
MDRRDFLLATAAGLSATSFIPRRQAPPSALGQPDRLAWWREARFGLFIHWGLYSLLAGEWDGRTDYGEWIRNNARIPLETYDTLLERFNPTAFDAAQWMRAAREAGMRYVVTTTKHHDGFALFDSAVSDFDVMATPFKRDIMRELSRAARREGLRVGWYHSIMDWHHPDYLPRRDWEADLRPAGDADFDRYVRYLRAQVRELLTQYGDIDIMWFDGQWESSWTHERGQALYDLCRELAPRILVNNRVDVAPEGGTSTQLGPDRAGDFGTPEQEIPPMGLPGVAWESCITMNRNWGYNRADHDWKSPAELVRLLVDTASKGGNLLLNVGPTGEGRFPEESLARLAALGRWMRTHGGAIYGTEASPFPNPALVATRKGHRVHLFLPEWRTGNLRVPSLRTPVREAWFLSAAGHQPVEFRERDQEVLVTLPGTPPDPLCSVLVLEYAGPAVATQ